MPDYAYSAATPEGNIVRGYRYANDENELIAALKTSGLQVVEYEASASQSFLRKLESINIGGVSRKTLIEFSNNCGVMLKAGVPIITALDELREDCENKYFKKILGQIIADIQAGDTLNESMAKHPRVFPELYTNVVEIGENTGSLDAVFFDLARHFKRIDDLVSNVRKAMIYPSFVLAVLILVAFIFLIKVFPPLFELMEEFNVELPTITVIVMNTSKFLQNYWVWIVCAVVAFFVLFGLARKNRNTRYYIDWCELNLPILKGLFIQLRLAFFMRYLSMLLVAGMDILRSLKLANESVHNLVIQKFLNGSRQRVLDGELFSESLKGSVFMPNMVIRMIGIGEQAGNLPEQMEYVADHYNEELERKIATALAMMEPILIVILAGFALSLAMGVLLPLYNLVSTLSTGVGQGTM